MRREKDWGKICWSRSQKLSTEKNEWKEKLSHYLYPSKTKWLRGNRLSGQSEVGTWGIRQSGSLIQQTSSLNSVSASGESRIPAVTVRFELKFRVERHCLGDGNRRPGLIREEMWLNTQLRHSVLSATYRVRVLGMLSVFRAMYLCKKSC